MMVLFVSECEKKAIRRTQRVLDSFANRLGHRTWQTVITEDGLHAVKKLLRQSATKNTAVSCHWIRSRRRSDLLWIIGNCNRFSHAGLVPVNSTQKDVFMDVITMKPKQDEFYANTHLQPLGLHSFAVGYLAKKLLEHTVDNSDHHHLADIAFLGGCLHDLGKLDPLFQNWVKKGKQKDSNDDGQHIDIGKFTFDTHPRHNEISLFLFNLFEELHCKNISNSLKEALYHVIYWHHAKPYRNNEQFTGVYKVYKYLHKNITDDGLKTLACNAVNMLQRIHQIAIHYDGSLNQIEKKLPWEINVFTEQLDAFIYRKKDVTTFPVFKEYDEMDNFDSLAMKISINARNNLLRACIISADRIISALSVNDLTEYINQNRLNELIVATQDTQSGLLSHLADSLTRFPDSARTNKQTEVAKKLADIDEIAVLAGAAGCGKTKIALEWAHLKKAQKIIWICPRVQVCQGIFEELTGQYLPDTQIEIFTGEFKYTNTWNNITKEEDYFSADVVVTTIDQILEAIVTHNKINSLLPFMAAHIIFDEYHEYIGMEIFNLLFAELVANKQMRTNGQKNTLLVSATPHYFYLNEVLKIDADYDVIEMPSFNPSQYCIEFIKYDEKDKQNNPFYQMYTDNTFIISNTAQTAQLSFICQQNNENSILFHSRFKRNDKKNIFNEVFNAFKKEGTRKYDVLRSGPIVQASLNISCNHMMTEMSTPENILQRLGRLDRFGQNSDINLLKIAITEDMTQGKCKSASSFFLNSLHGLQSAKAWYEHLTEHLAGRTFTLPEIYQLYQLFYKTESIRLLIKQDLEKALKSSIMLICNKVTEPTRIIKGKSTERKMRISKHSLRGDNRFIQLALLDVNNYLKPEFINEYAYSIPLNDTEEVDNLTESLSFIRNSGLINFIAQKHGNIDVTHPVKNIPIKKQIIRIQVLENYARDAAYPLYLSYIEDDLNQVGGTDTRHLQAIYYAICDKQPVGAIGIDKITELTNAHIKE